MKGVSVFLGVLLAFVLSGVAQAATPLSGHVAARHKPGPVTIRGVAVHVTSASLTLQTKTHGSYTVSISSNTAVDEKGRTGHVTVAEGDHIGVRGFVHGRQLTAIHIRIYPVKPKAYSVRGTVAAVHGSELVVDVSGKTLTVHVGGNVPVRIGSQTGSLKQIRVGDRIDVRVQGTGGAITALHVHIYRSRTPVSHVELRGTVSSVAPGSVAVIAGSQRQTVAVTASTRVYLGNRRGTLHDLKAGQSVRIYASGAGQSLTATSIHIRRTPVTRASTLVRGQVTSVSPRAITVATTHGDVTFALSPSTVVEVGTTPPSTAGHR